MLKSYSGTPWHGNSWSGFYSLNPKTVFIARCKTSEAETNGSSSYESKLHLVQPRKTRQTQTNNYKSSDNKSINIPLLLLSLLLVVVVVVVVR